MREGWEYKKLGEVATLINGFAFQSAMFQKAGLPIVRISNIQDDKITSDFVYFNRGDYNIDFEKYEVLYGDILIAMSGATTGKVGINYNDEVLYLNQRVGKIVPRENIIQRYLFYYLKTNAAKSLSIAQGVAQPNLSTQQINSFVLPVPPLSEQQRIVSELDLLSSIIEKKKTQLKEYDQLAQSIFYDMFGDPVENPKGWEVKRYRDFAEIIGGYAFNSKSFVDSGVPVLKIGNINTGVLRLEEICYYPYTPSLKRYEVHSGDLVISLTGTTGKDDYGNICIIPSYADTFYLNQRNAILRPNETCNNIFLQYVFKQRTIKKELTKNNHGVRQANILNQDILGLSIPLPPLPLQQSFASKIEAIERQKALIQQSIAEVQMLFDSHMDDWFA